ncbi:hypothetical protein [Thermoflexus hugenholtzii]
MSFRIAFLYVLIRVLLTGAGPSLYPRRAAREMGMGGLVAVGIWIGLAILLARGCQQLPILLSFITSSDDRL